jgi:hypothetical protein
VQAEVYTTMATIARSASSTTAADVAIPTLMPSAVPRTQRQEPGHTAAPACTDAPLRPAPVSAVRAQEPARTDGAGAAQRALPPPRGAAAGAISAGTQAVPLRFTARVFPTPLRDSRKQQEEDWLDRNKAHLGQRAPEGAGGTVAMDGAANFTDRDRE